MKCVHALASALWVLLSVFVALSTVSAQSRERRQAATKERALESTPANVVTIKGRVLWSDPPKAIPNVRIHLTNPTKDRREPDRGGNGREGKLLRSDEGRHVQGVDDLGLQEGRSSSVRGRAARHHHRSGSPNQRRASAWRSSAVVFQAKDKEGNDVFGAPPPERKIESGDSSVVDFKLSCR